MNRKALVKTAAVILSLCIAAFQMSPGLERITWKAVYAEEESSAAEETEQPGQEQEEQAEAKEKAAEGQSHARQRYRKKLPAAAELQKIPAKDSVVSKSGEAQYIIQAENRKLYRTVCEQYKEDRVEGSERREGLQKEKILVAELPAAEAEELSSREGVVVERDVLLYGAGSENETSYGEAVREVVEEAWDIQAVNAETVPVSGDAIRIAVLDSGRDKLSDIPFEQSVSMLKGEKDTYGEDFSGHGNAVASIIHDGEFGQATAGIIGKQSPIGLCSVKVLNCDNEAPVSRIVEGIQWCIDHEVDIINMSFGTPYYSVILEDAIIRAGEAGILMVAAAGNQGETETGIVEYPAAYSQVIGVGSVNEKMEHSSFSATGEEVELSAPGENVPISGYWGMMCVDSGTSYAAPHVTAVAALLWSRDSTKSPDFIRRLLQVSARDLGEHNVYGYGLVDYEYASTIYNTFAEEYQQEADAPFQEIGNPAEPEEYSVPEKVQASWRGENHTEYLIGRTEFSATDFKYIQVGAVAPDYKFGGIDFSTSSFDNKSEYFDVLHARKDTNYVQAVCLLMNAALEIKERGLDAMVVLDLIESCNNYQNSKETTHQKQQDREALRQVINIVSKKKLKVVYDDESGKDKVETDSGIPSANRASLQLLGIAIHVIGDAYAHETVLQYRNFRSGDPENDILKSLQEQKVINYDKLRDDIFSGKIVSTSQIRDYVRDGSAPKTAHRAVADNPDFLRIRLDKGTQFATDQLIFMYCFPARRWEIPYAFCPLLQHPQYNLRLKGLKRFFKDSGLDFADFALVSVSEWQSLSK